MNSQINNRKQEFICTPPPGPHPHSTVNLVNTGNKSGHTVNCTHKVAVNDLPAGVSCYPADRYQKNKNTQEWWIKWLLLVVCLPKYSAWDHSQLLGTGNDTDQMHLALLPYHPGGCNPVNFKTHKPQGVRFNVSPRVRFGVKWLPAKASKPTRKSGFSPLFFNYK